MPIFTSKKIHISMDGYFNNQIDIFNVDYVMCSVYLR